VEARTPPRYAAFFPSGRHQLSRIARGIFDLAVAIGLLFLWSPEAGEIWWWVRGFLFALFVFMAIGSLKRGLFASDAAISRMVAGDYNAKD
jgi:hypothetical protein